MIVRYRSLGNSGNINSILCYLPTTNLEKEKLLTSLSIYRSKEWKKERKTHLIVPRSGDEEVGFGTEAKTGHGISGRLIHLQKQNSPLKTITRKLLIKWNIDIEFRYLEGLVRVRISVAQEIRHLQIFSEKIESLEFGGSWLEWRKGFCAGEGRCRD